MKELPDESVDMVMTSPPYWALRDYGVEGQLGLEPTFQEYINKLCDIFDEVKRVLKKEGTCWVNMGDTYGSGFGERYSAKSVDFKRKWMDVEGTSVKKKPLQGFQKSLLQIPSRFAIEMCNRGWILRNEIIWHKPNCMPSSVKDRFTVDFEKLFFFVKNKKYWFETQYEPAIDDEETFYKKLIKKEHKLIRLKNPFSHHDLGKARFNPQGRNKRCVWCITTKPYKEAHFATYPEELCETPIKAGCPEFVCKKCGKAREKIIETKSTNIEGWGKCNKDSKLTPDSTIRDGKGRMGDSQIEIKGYTDCGCNAGWEGGIVLDPFFGAGTTGLVALKQNKNFIGIELSEEYIKIAEKRLEPLLKQLRLAI